MANNLYEIELVLTQKDYKELEKMNHDIFSTTGSGTRTHTLTSTPMVSVEDLLLVFPELCANGSPESCANFARKVRVAAQGERQADALAELRTGFQIKNK